MSIGTAMRHAGHPWSKALEKAVSGSRYSFVKGRSVAMIRHRRNTMRCRSMLAASFAVLALAGISADSNWPQFRGSQAGVAADDPALPETWSPTENIVWKADVRGVGWGSPVVWGDHIFLTSAVNTER